MCDSDPLSATIRAGPAAPVVSARHSAGCPHTNGLVLGATGESPRLVGHASAARSRDADRHAPCEDVGATAQERQPACSDACDSSVRSHDSEVSTWMSAVDWASN
jgi:hypothetical protein